MKLQLKHLHLLGTDRRFSFLPGLNIISGPIATGKTTLVRCAQGLLGSSLRNFSREARDTITDLVGEIEIGIDRYQISRPFVTTRTARVDIAGSSETLRVPALAASSFQEQTYGRWLQNKLGLPVLQVPLAPSREDSDFSPVSVNDYLMYCYLEQDEIDKSVFGHDNYYKNNKRKYVFDIVYRRYDVRIAQLQEQLRDRLRELRRLQNHASTLDELLENTPFANQAAIERDIDLFTVQLEQLEQESSQLAASVTADADVQAIRASLQKLDVEISSDNERIRSEELSIRQLNELISQLKTQSARLTRSIVAEEYLLDFDFLICPRCGSSVAEDRVGDSGHCYLCLQEPELDLTRDDLIREQNRLERQIVESEELVKIHSASIENLILTRDNLKSQRLDTANELEYRTQSFVSDSASAIAAIAEKRAELRERIRNLQEYLELHRRLSRLRGDVSRLESEITEIQIEIDAALGEGTLVQNAIPFLEQRFAELLDDFLVPSFSEGGITGIDRQTLLPIVQGRRFDELQSPGLKVLVNVAHTIAHQLTALEFGLNLPNIMLIDGLSGNLGYEGLDLERVEAIYGYLVRLSRERGEDLQIIVADNTVPQVAHEFVRVTFSEEEKLIPESALSRP